MRVETGTGSGSSILFLSSFLALALGVAACRGDERESRRPGSVDATRIVTDTIEGVLSVQPDGLTVRRCGESEESWVIEATGADLRYAVKDLGAGSGDRLRLRAIGESVAPPEAGPGSDHDSAIRVVQWVYLAEDLSGCSPGEQPEAPDYGASTDGGRRMGDSAAVESAAERFRDLASNNTRQDTVQGVLEQGDATSYFTAFVDTSGSVVRLEERLDLGEYGSRSIEYGLSAGSLFFVREEGTLRDLSPSGAGDLLPRGFEVAYDSLGRIEGSSRYGPGFEEGIEAAAGGAREHLDRLLELVEERLAAGVPKG
jgi:hypothetical protein